MSTPNAPRIIPVDELQKGGTRYVRLVDGPALEAIVAQAVGAALRKSGSGTDGHTGQVLEAAQQEVRKALKQATTETQDVAEKRRRQQLEAATVRLRAEVGHTELRLRLLQGRPAELDCRVLSPEAVDGLAARVREVLADLASRGELHGPEGDPFGAAAGAEGWRNRFSKIADEVLTAERRRLVTELERSRAERQEVLGRRIAELREELTRKQEELARPAEGAPPAELHPFQVPPAGLDPADPFLVWRWRLLNMTFIENLQLQGRALPGPAATDSSNPSQEGDGPSRAWLYQALSA